MCKPVSPWQYAVRLLLMVFALNVTLAGWSQAQQEVTVIVDFPANDLLPPTARAARTGAGTIASNPIGTPGTFAPATKTQLDREEKKRLRNWLSNALGAPMPLPLHSVMNASSSTLETASRTGISPFRRLRCFGSLTTSPWACCFPSNALRLSWRRRRSTSSALAWRVWLSISCR